MKTFAFLALLITAPLAAEGRPSLAQQCVAERDPFLSSQVRYPQMLAQTNVPGTTRHTFTLARGMSWGMMEGEIHAERPSTRGTLSAGLFTGVMTGLLGTGIGYFIVGPAPLDAKAYQALEGKGADYQYGFEIGWKKKTKFRKRSAFLGGGMLGTVVFVVFFVL